jgi:hypothetical protein
MFLILENLQQLVVAVVTEAFAKCVSSPLHAQVQARWTGEVLAEDSNAEFQVLICMLSVSEVDSHLLLQPLSQEWSPE